MESPGGWARPRASVQSAREVISTTSRDLSVGGLQNRPTRTPKHNEQSHVDRDVRACSEERSPTSGISVIGVPGVGLLHART